MNFLGLPFLFALPLIAVPVIIHLYRGRQRDVISWGAMQFLAEATTKGRSLQRLEELLLMCLRVAAVLALILALARPMLRSFWFGAGADREVVMVLDNSLSMARAVDGASSNDLMIERAVELVGELSSNDTVHIMLASCGGQWLTAEGLAADSGGKSQLVGLLEQIEPTLGTANLLDCLQIAVNLEPHEEPAARRIVVFTDDQAISWQLESEGIWRQLGSAREKSKVPTSIDIVECQTSEKELDNLAVMRIESSRQLAQPDERLDFTARIANVGGTTTEETLVEWLIDDQVFESSKLRSLAPGEATQVEAKLRQKESGNFAISCRIVAEDEIALDGQASVVIEVSDQLPILVVYDLVDDAFTKTADQLFTAALGYDGDRAQPWHSVYEPELVSVAELEDINFARYRAVVMLNLADLSSETHERLQAFVRRGGGLWVALGDLIDGDTFNRYWHDDGGGMSPISLDTLVSVQDTNTPEGSIHPPEKDHPATMQLANTTQLDIDQAKLSEYWRFVHSGDLERELWVLLESGDGSPLVVENIIGDGRVLIQAFPLGLEWTNFPLLKSYVVMIHDWLDYLTAPAMARYNLEPGNAITAIAPKELELASATLTTPAGNEVEIASSGGEEGGLVRYSQTQLPGMYRLNFDTADTETSLPFYVQRDSKESQWQPLVPQHRSQLLELAGLQFDGSQTVETPVSDLDPSPRSEPIWGALLLALVGLLIGEQLLSNWLARQRTGVAVTTT